MESILIANYEREGIDALRRVNLTNLSDEEYYDLLHAIMAKDDEKSFRYLPKGSEFRSSLKMVIRASRELSVTKFLQMMIKRCAFITIIFEVVERNDRFDADDVCTVLLAYAEMGLLERIRELNSSELKVIKALRRVTCDV